MKTGKLLILSKNVGIVQQALPLRVCRQVKEEACCCRSATLQGTARGALPLPV